MLGTPFKSDEYLLVCFKNTYNSILIVGFILKRIDIYVRANFLNHVKNYYPFTRSKTLADYNRIYPFIETDELTTFEIYIY